MAILNVGGHIGSKYRTFYQLDSQFNHNTVPKSYVKNEFCLIFFWVIATFRNISYLFSAILNFGSHICTKYEIVFNLVLSPIIIPFQRAIKYWIIYESFWVILTFLNIFDFFRPFLILAAILVNNIYLFWTKLSAQSYYHENKLSQIRFCWTVFLNSSLYKNQS